MRRRVGTPVPAGSGRDRVGSTNLENRIGMTAGGVASSTASLPAAGLFPCTAPPRIAPGSPLAGTTSVFGLVTKVEGFGLPISLLRETRRLADLLLTQQLRPVDSRGPNPYGSTSSQGPHPQKVGHRNHSFQIEDRAKSSSGYRLLSSPFGSREETNHTKERKPWKTRKRS